MLQGLRGDGLGAERRQVLLVQGFLAQQLLRATLEQIPAFVQEADRPVEGRVHEVANRAIDLARRFLTVGSLGWQGTRRAQKRRPLRVVGHMPELAHPCHSA